MASVPIKTGFLVFGLQRIGTNYLQELMRKNFVNCQDRNVWKHRVDLPTEEKVKSKIIEPAILILYKNPYKWIESVAVRGGVDYVRTQTKYPAKEFVGISKDLALGAGKLNPVNLAKTYKEHYKNWVEELKPFLKKRSTIIKYEDLLIDDKREQILSEIQKKYKFQKQHENKWINPSQVSMSKKFSQEKKEYYLSNKLEHLKKPHLDAINEIFDEEFLSKLGYDKITNV